jgi:hypothetical protein
MENKTKDLLLRGVPIEVYQLLQRSAKENHRSKNQEAIVALTNGLSSVDRPIAQPNPFKWKKKISSRFIQKAIEEGRE